jgi:hypothetical protein
MPPKAGRNDPCACGSGLKFKRCCLNSPVPRDSLPRSIFAHPLRLPPIIDTQDLQIFWDAYLGSFQLWRLSRKRALAAIFQFIDSRDRTWMMLEGKVPQPWRELGNEALHYLAMHAHRRCPSKGREQPPSAHDLGLVEATAKHVVRLARIRDHIEACRVGYGVCRIDIDARRVTFAETEGTALDLSRREQESSDRDARLRERLAGTHDDPEVRAVVDEVRSLIDSGYAPPTDTAEDQVLLGSLKLHDLVMARSPDADGLLLPDDLDLGPYKVRDYRSLWRYLAAFGLAEEARWASRLGEPPWFNPPQVIIARTAILEQMKRWGTGESAAIEVIRDLTYTGEVDWLPIADHPLVPIGQGRFMTATRLLWDRGWQGRMLRSVERLPWRTRARDVVNSNRESIMQGSIEEAASVRGLRSRRRVRVGPKAEPVGDVDLLCWRDPERDGLALSLKWFYPPNYVQEGASQERRLAREVVKHEKMCASWSTHAERASFRELPADLLLAPVVVVEPGPVREALRRLSTPVLCLDDFLTVIREGRWESTSQLFLALKSKASEEPRWRVRYENVHLPLAGDWRFYVPVPVDFESGEV